MAYYVSDVADEAYVPEARQLIHHLPAPPSRWSRTTGFSPQSTSFARSLSLRSSSCSSSPRSFWQGAGGVVDAEDLLIERPRPSSNGSSEKVGIPFLPESLTWQPEWEQEWKDWEMWRLDAGDSTSFQKDMEDLGYTVDDVPGSGRCTTSASLFTRRCTRSVFARNETRGPGRARGTRALPGRLRTTSARPGPPRGGESAAAGEEPTVNHHPDLTSSPRRRGPS